MLLDVDILRTVLLFAGPSTMPVGRLAEGTDMVSAGDAAMLRLLILETLVSSNVSLSILLISSSIALAVPVVLDEGSSEVSLKNLMRRPARGPGCSSGIQCPEEGIIIAETLFAIRLADSRL